MSKTHLGHTARKRFGQNFLHDDYVIDKIVSAINPQDNENLVTLYLIPFGVCCITILLEDSQEQARSKKEEVTGSF